MRVVAGIIFRRGRLLAALRPHSVSRGGLWEFPGGKVEPGESDRAALHRELMEELALTVEIGTQLATSVHHYPELEVELVGYRCTALSLPRALEHDELRWLRPDELHTLKWAAADLPLVRAVSLAQ